MSEPLLKGGKVKKPRNPDKPHGIKVQAVMAWLLGVYKGDRKTPPPVPSSDDPTAFHGGSPNMKLLYAVALYIWTVITKASDLEIHRSRLRQFLEREQRCHGNGEPTTSSHGQLWLAGIAAALWGAERETDHGGYEVKSLAIDWLRVEHAIHTVTRDEEDGMWCPGARGKSEPNTPREKLLGSNSTRPKMWAAITTGKVPGKVNQYDLGAWFISKCSAESRAEIQRWPETFPPMIGAFHARRWENGDFYAYYDSLEGCADVTLSAGRIGGEKWISEGVPPCDHYYQKDTLPVLTIDAPKGICR